MYTSVMLSLLVTSDLLDVGTHGYLLSLAIIPPKNTRRSPQCAFHAKLDAAPKVYFLQGKMAKLIGKPTSMEI